MPQYVSSLMAQLPEPRLRKMMKNFLHNIFFPLSALAYFTLAVQRAYEIEVCTVSVVLAVFMMSMVATQVPDLWQPTRQLPWSLQSYAFLAAAGVCWFYFTDCTNFFTLRPDFAEILRALSASVDMTRVFGMGMSLAAFPFLAVVFSFLLSSVRRLLTESGIFRTFNRAEWLLYALLTIVLLAYAAWAFSLSNGFYSANNGGYDIVYTADTDALYNNMAYLSLTFVENDLRQPLFALFSAPFAGVPYVISHLLGLTPALTAILFNSVQVLLLMAGHLMLTALVGRTPFRRFAFLLLLCASYTTLLNAVMVEQYITAYFWLMLTVVAICQGTSSTRLPFLGASGSLLTSAAIAPWCSCHSLRRTPRRWLWDMCKLTFSGIGLLVAFGRFDVLYSVAEKIASLSKFTGSDSSFSSRFAQYSSFLHDCFLAPAAGIAQGSAPDGILSWRLDVVSSLHPMGMALMLLFILSAWLHRRQRLCQVAFYWSIFSCVLLAVIGWGTWEVGLILYSLYFCWCFLLLLFRLLERLAEKLHAAWLVPVASLLGALIMLSQNVPGMQALIDYCVTFFPL